MFLSKYFLPVQKEVPSDAMLISHQLMLRAGMIKQAASGIYFLLPLGLKVIRKIEEIIRQEFNKEGFNEILIPTIQPAELWKESGRYNDYGKEMLKITDRHNAELLFGPTGEEMATFAAKGGIKSYKELPMVIYNIHWKFRDEIRPRFGLMRAREFLMLDSYSFHLTEADAKDTYNRHYDVYLKIFARLGLIAIPMQASTGEIGGDLSHEFHIIAESGESEIIYESELDDIIRGVGNRENFENLRMEINKFYAVTSEKHDPAQAPNKKLLHKRGIEVGHNFYFGDKYSSAMKLALQDKEGKLFHPLMGSYGIGIGRLMAAFIEVNHDAKGIIWNESTSPFDFYICDITKQDSARNFALHIYQALLSKRKEALFDDTSEAVGVKFAKADLIGIPQRIVISDKLFAENSIEIKNRKTGEILVVPVNSFLEEIK